MKVLFVCTGNLCRSPMAEALLRHELASRACDGVVEVVSSGTWAGFDHPATFEAVKALKHLGIDLSEHRSRPAQAREISEADVVVAMTSVHLREIRDLAPDVGDKLVLLKELAEIERPEVLGDNAQERLATLLSAQRPRQRRSFDVDDPMGLPISAYERCIRDLRDGVEVLAEIICP